MKKLLLPFLLPLAGFAAVKGVYWYQVKTMADELGQRLAPFASVKYAGVIAGFDGVVGVTDLRITPHGDGSSLEIGALRVKAPSWTYFLKGMSAEEGELPSQLGLELDDVVIDMKSAYLNTLAPESSKATLGCLGAARGVELVEALGYQRLVTDLALSYVFNPASEFVSLLMTAKVEADFRVELRADLDLGVNQLTRQGLAQVVPRLGDLELHYRDDSFNQRRNRYCAELNDETIPVFVNRHIALLADHYRSLGFDFSETLEAAYGQFSLTGGTLDLSLRAAEPIGFPALARYGPADYLAVLEIGVAINDREIDPLALSWSAPAVTPKKALALLETAAAAEQLVEVERVASEPIIEEIEAVAVERVETAALQPPSGSPPVFRRVATSALDQYPGSRLRITTRNGRVIEGVLLSLSRNGLRLRQKLGNGEAILPITFNRVDFVEAFH